MAQVVAEQREHRRLRTLPVDSDTLAMLRHYIRQGDSVSRDGTRVLFGIGRHRAWQIVKDMLLACRTDRERLVAHALLYVYGASSSGRW